MCPDTRMISHVLDAATDLQEMYGDRVSEGVDRPTADARGLGIGSEEVLHLALLERTLPTSRYKPTFH